MVACWSAHLVVVTWLAPESLSARALAHSGPVGQGVMALLLVLSVFAILDGLVNDLLPERYHLLTIRYRHMGFMAIAIILVALAFAIVSTGHHLPAVLSYLLAAGFSVWVAVLDMTARHHRIPPRS